MRAFIAVAACCLMLSVSGFAPRQRRDVSELATAGAAVEQPAYEYLPPEPKLLPALQPEGVEIETTEAPFAVTTLASEPSVRVGENGYEYRTVRRLKYRTRRLRDVSHLSAHYLPPATKAAAPSRDYLPPTTQAAVAPAPAPIDDTEEVVAAPAAPKVSNDYLPPVQEVAVVTEPIDIETEAPVAAVQPEDVEPERAVEEEEQPQDTAILAEDGYHYKQPEQPFELKAAAPAPVTPAAAAEEYLPPLNDDTVAVEGPEESAVLAADGYHYRAIRRLRF